MFRTSFILTCAALAFSCSAALSGPAAAAQSESVTVNIPFNFSANDQKLPAGRYHVSVESGRYLSFINMETGKNQQLMVLPAWKHNAQDQGRLIFRRYGSSNYLSQVWMPGQDAGSEFIRSRGERETLRALKSATVAQVQLPLGAAK